MLCSDHISARSVDLSGRRFNGFSKVEEEQTVMDTVPFLLEDKIKDLGGRNSKAAEP